MARGARTQKLAQKSIRRNFFAKVGRMRDDARVSIIKLEIPEFGQEKAASLDVWCVLDISKMDNAELSYAFEDGVESIEDTIGFMGGVLPKELGFFVLEHHAKNEIAYSPVHDTLYLTVAVRWYDNKGGWRAGIPEKPEDPSLQYSMVSEPAPHTDHDVSSPGHPPATSHVLTLSCVHHQVLARQKQVGDRGGAQQGDRGRSEAQVRCVPGHTLQVDSKMTTRCRHPRRLCCIIAAY